MCDVFDVIMISCLDYSMLPDGCYMMQGSICVHMCEPVIVYVCVYMPACVPILSFIHHSRCKVNYVRFWSDDNVKETSPCDHRVTDTNG